MDRTRRLTSVALAALLLIGVLAAPAAAHVGVTPGEVDSPSFQVRFRIGHGCEGTPTTAVRIRIPEGVEDARPEPVEGWEADVVDGGEEVAWTGGSLPDGQVGEFPLSGRFTEAARDVVFFPVVQECVEGEHRWIEIPPTLEEWGDLDEPAPYVVLAFRDGEPGATVEPTGEATNEPTPEATGEASGEASDEPIEAATGTEGPPVDGDEAAAPGPDGGLGPLPLAAMVAGLLGLGLGAAALVRARRG